MNELLYKILEAHGGLERWNKYERVEATIVSGGGLFPLKGVPQDSSPRRMTVWLHEERSSVFPYGAPDQRTMFTPERTAVEKLDGTLVAERYAPRDSFAGHQMNTPWDALHRAYFNGYALWTYLTTPFLLAMDGVRVEETESWREGAETWRVLRACFPGDARTSEAGVRGWHWMVADRAAVSVDEPQLRRLILSVQDSQRLPPAATHSTAGARGVLYKGPAQQPGKNSFDTTNLLFLTRAQI